LRARSLAPLAARGDAQGSMGSGPETNSPDATQWQRGITVFERIIVRSLVVLLMVVVTVSTIELGWILLRDLMKWDKLALDVEEMLELFGFFLLVLIGLELITTLKAYMTAGVVHGEVVLEVALIAVAQKIIIFDASRANGITVIGLAVLILSLAASFWLVRAASRRRDGGAGACSDDG
jgi:uncharacterized membrane protein (DUF373 family)